jgi:hypothetical protein
LTKTCQAGEWNRIQEAIQRCRLKRLGITGLGKVDIPTCVDKSTNDRRHNPSETKLRHVRLLIRTSLDVPDIESDLAHALRYRELMT